VALATEEPDNEECEDFTFALYWGREYVRACEDEREVEHRYEIARRHYMAAVERLKKNRPQSESMSIEIATS
jgi:hypothetical protein